MAVGLGLLALGSRRLNPYLKELAQRRFSRETGMQLEIGALRGNPLTGLELERVRLGAGGEPLMVLDAARARYRLTALFRGAVIVDTLVLVAPRVRLPEGAPLPGADGGPLPSSLSAWWKARPKWDIRVRRVEVVDGRCRLGAAGKVDSLNLVLGFRAGPGGYELALSRFRSLLFDPPLVVRELTGLTLLSDGRLRIDGLRVRTPGSSVRIDGTMTPLSRPEYDFKLRADSLSFTEIARIRPGAYPRGSLALDGRFRGDGAGMRADLKLRFQSADCTLSGRVEFDTDDVAYDVEAAARGVDLVRIVPDLGIDARFDAKIRLEGRGLDPDSAEATLDAAVSRALFYNVAVDTADLRASFEDGRLILDVTAEGDAGGLSALLAVDRKRANPLHQLSARVTRLDLSRISRKLARVTDLSGEIWLRRFGGGVWRGEAGFDVVNVMGFPPATGLALRGSFHAGVLRLDSLGVRLSGGFGVAQGRGGIDLGRFWERGGRLPTYRLDVRLDGLSPERLANPVDFIEDVSLRIGLDGEGLHPDSVRARADVTVKASRFLGGRLDSAGVRLARDGRRTRLDRLFLAGETAVVRGEGWVAGDSLNIRADGRVNDFRALYGVVGSGLSGSPASFDARVGGVWTNAVAAIALAADSVNYRGVPIHGVRLELARPGHPSGRLSVRADSLVWGGRAVHDVSLDAGLDEDVTSFVLGSRPADADYLHLRGRVRRFDAGYDLELDSLAVGMSGAFLSNDGPFKVVFHPEEGLLVERFRLVGDGVIHARGRTWQPEGLVVRLDDVNLRTWSPPLRLKNEVGGTLTGEITLAGSLAEPRVAAAFGILNGNLAGVRFQDLSGAISYRDRRAGVDLKLVQSPGLEAEVRGRFPLDPASGREDDLFPEGPVSLSIESDGVDLALFPDPSAGIRDLGGILAAKLDVGGTPRMLRPSGWVRLRDGAARIAPLNKTLKNVQAELSFDERQNVLGRIEAAEGRGRFGLSGRVSLAQSGFERYDIAVRAKEYEAINLPDLRATIDADVKLAGDPAGGRAIGNVALARADLRLSEFISYPTDLAWIRSGFFENLGCEIRVSASRNVWVRDRDLDLEISGDVDLVRDREGFRIYGSLDSRRGQYEFQNATFAIDRGELHFQGKPEINPDVYILATRRVRLASNENAVISVVVGGTLLNPKLTLESDTTPPLPEADILSYLLIGRPADDVSGLMRDEGVDGRRLDDQAAALVLGLAANRLKRTIGRRLNLDVVEIDFGMGDSATRVRAGKYFGSRFFVSYAQDVSEARGKEVVVEYELLPQVTLEAQQRVDGERDRTSLGIFWKKEW